MDSSDDEKGIYYKDYKEDILLDNLEELTFFIKGFLYDNGYYDPKFNIISLYDYFFNLKRSLFNVKLEKDHSFYIGNLIEKEMEKWRYKKRENLVENN